MRLPFIGGAYKGRSTDANPEDAINLFVERGASELDEGAVQKKNCEPSWLKITHSSGGR